MCSLVGHSRGGGGYVGGFRPGVRIRGQLRNLYHLMAVLIVLVDMVLSMLMVFVVFVVGRRGRWRPISRRDTKSGKE